MRIEEYWKEVIFKKRNKVIDKLFLHLLYFFSYLYQIIWGLNLLFYRIKFLKKDEVQAKVISIGNITLGGVGKTPHTIKLAKFFKEKGYNVSVLSRGYKSKIKRNFRVISTFEDLEAQIIGDEPYLFAKNSCLPLIVGRDRRKTASFAVKEFLSNLIILDDGYQYLPLKKNKEVVLIDSALPFGNKRVFPAGILRERIKNLNRADIIILTKVNKIDKKTKVSILKEIREISPDKPIFESFYKPLFFKRFPDDKIFGLDLIKDKELSCFFGIANPYSFIDDIKKLKPKSVIPFEFSNHYFYKEEDIKDIINRSKKLNINFIITTEKDIVRIPKLKFEHPIYYLVSEVEIKDFEKLSQMLIN